MSGDSDIAAIGRILDERSKTRRAANRQDGARQLLLEHIPFESNNGGAHLIVGSGREYDFWPGTGRWCSRHATGDHGRGVASLITRIRALKEGTKT